MPTPPPRYAAIEMPLNLRRRQRQNVTDAKHVAGTGSADTVVEEPVAAPVRVEPIGLPVTVQPVSPERPAQPFEQAARTVSEDQGPVGSEGPERAEGAERAAVIALGAGPPKGLPLVLALSRAGHEVVAVEHDRTAVGLRLANLGAVIPAPGS